MSDDRDAQSSTLIKGMATDVILAAWPLDSPWTIRCLAEGNNNLSYAVTSPQGRYILRIYQNTADPGRVRYEHALLRELQREPISFAVPVPIRTRSGDTLVPVSGGTVTMIAALFHVIPGRHPDGEELRHYPICGAALAELDRGLGHIDLPPPMSGLRPFRDLSRIHPAVPDPLRLVADLPLPRDRLARLLSLVHHLQSATSWLYQTLPQQIVHRDFDASNVLMENGRVTGIVDFEFACPDLRALDLAIALCQFSEIVPDDVTRRQRSPAAPQSLPHTSARGGRRSFMDRE